MVRQHPDLAELIISGKQVDVSVVPAWMVNEECVQQYLLGRTWYECSTDIQIYGYLDL